MKRTHIILLFIITSVISVAQTPTDNLYKYYYLRQRLRNDFVIIDANNRQGTNIPASGRNVWGNWLGYGENPMLGSIAPYTIMLATEYAVNKKYGLDNTQTLNELSYVFQAIERLDLNAEKFFRAEKAGLAPKDPDFWTKVDNYIEPQDLNGFSLRSDIDGHEKDSLPRKYTKDSTRFIYNMNNSKLKYVDYYHDFQYDYNNGIITDSTDGGIKHVSITWLGSSTGIETNNRSVQSQDEIWGLYLAMSIVAKLVDSPIKFTDAESEQVTIRDWVAKIIYRAQLNLTIVDAWVPPPLDIFNWNIINPYTHERVKYKNGGSTWGLSFGFWLSSMKIILSTNSTIAPKLATDIYNIYSANENADIFLGALLGARLTYTKDKSEGIFNLGLISGTASLWYYTKLMKSATRHTKMIAYENYPLYWSILSDTSLEDNWVNLKNFITYNDYVDSLETLLNIMPKCGGYGIGYHNKLSDPYWFQKPRGITYNTYRIKEQCVLDSNGMYIKANMDYLILFNLYYLLISDNLIFTDESINVNYPNSEFGSNSQPAVIRRANFLMNHKINSNGNVTLIASNKITLLPGFKVEKGANFVAYIEGGNACNLNFYSPPCSPQNLFYAKEDTVLNSQNNCSPIKKNDALNNLDIEEDSSFIFSVYPNPVFSTLNVKINQSYKSTRISLIDYSGNIIKKLENTNNSFEIDFSNYSAGVYLLLIETNTNTYTKTIIKK